MQVHLVDGTYELFRHYYGYAAARGTPSGKAATRGVVTTVVSMLEEGATHVGVATDHVIESFRNELWPGYKTGDGIDPALLAQFHPLEDSLAALGIAVWPMVEYEADDALASAASLAAADASVQKVCIWTPDKDLAQCVVAARVVQVERRSGAIRDAQAIKAKFGVDPELIPDFLALVGDTADGYPGLAGIGKTSAARLVSRYGRLENFPAEVLGARREQALLFKTLATLRKDLPLFTEIEQLRWRGATARFPAIVTQIGEARLLTRAARLQPLTAPGAAPTPPP